MDQIADNRHGLKTTLTILNYNFNIIIWQKDGLRDTNIVYENWVRKMSEPVWYLLLLKIKFKIC